MGTDGPSRSSQGEAPPGDEANLDYARKQTDLVLDKLADQLNKKDVDDQLLKDLGWTEEDLRRFIDRWNQRKEAARRNDPAGESANRELDEALRSLGLRPARFSKAFKKTTASATCAKASAARCRPNTETSCRNTIAASRAPGGTRRSRMTNSRMTNDETSHRLLSIRHSFIRHSSFS